LSKKLKYDTIIGCKGILESSMEKIHENIKFIEKYVKNYGEITIVAVTKTFPAQDVL
jgi:uncharacterized pyridoxal phosphate-containing UPF0001 family protein